MRRCAGGCNKEYPTDHRFCDDCGSFLVEGLDIKRIGTTIGNYHLLEIIGRGGMGTVYRAEHIFIKKKVAVKILHQRFAKYQDAITRFLREARAASLINHPNIVDVTDFGTLSEGGVYFVMEHLEGESLEDTIEKSGALPLHRALNITNQLSLALAAAHDQQIIHRDLKPENIMLVKRPGRRDIVRVDPSSAKGYVIEKEEEYDFVKILDFGIAKNHVPDELKGGKTLQGAVFGTPEYMSPEAARGDDVDFRADVYSLGIILFDMVCGRPPFEAEAADDVLRMQVEKPPMKPSEYAPEQEITPSTDALILKALQKNPDQRQSSMKAFREELQECYGSIVFARHSQSGGGITQRTPENRNRPISEELDDWLRSDQSLTATAARQLGKKK